MDRGAWRATVHGVAKSDMTESLSMPALVLTYACNKLFKFPVSQTLPASDLTYLLSQNCFSSFLWILVIRTTGCHGRAHSDTLNLVWKPAKGIRTRKRQRRVRTMSGSGLVQEASLHITSDEQGQGWNWEVSRVRSVRGKEDRSLTGQGEGELKVHKNRCVGTLPSRWWLVYCATPWTYPACSLLLTLYLLLTFPDVSTDLSLSALFF